MRGEEKWLHLEGLRGLAALAVVVHHLRLAFYPAALTEGLAPASWSGLGALLGEGICNGSFAVWLFWIMSAFVLSLRYFTCTRAGDTGAAATALKDGFWRRYPRLLLPVLASVGLAYGLLLSGAMNNQALARTLGDTDGTSWLARWYNFAPDLSLALKSAAWESFFSEPVIEYSYNPVLWTMGKEFYGSILLFALLAAVGRHPQRAWLYAVILVGCCLTKYYWPGAFVVGLWFCDLYVRQEVVSRFFYRRPLSFLRESRGLAVAAWLVILLAAGWMGSRPLCLVLGTAAVGFTLVSLPTRHFLSGAVPVFLGKISFGLYLVHQPLLCSFSGWVYNGLLPAVGPQKAAFLDGLVSLGVFLVAGWGLYWAVDRPSPGFSRWCVRQGAGRITWLRRKIPLFRKPLSPVLESSSASAGRFP